MEYIAAAGEVIYFFMAIVGTYKPSPSLLGMIINIDVIAAHNTILSSN